jgi:N utilization substance protein B
MGFRREARIVALQTLYELDCTDHSAEQVLARVANEKHLLQEALTFSQRLVEGVLQHRRRLDQAITEFAPAFPVEQMAAIDRNILRLAIFEILLDIGTPKKVAINEAVELAKAFGSNSSPRLINGILGSVVAKYGARDESVN